MLFFFPKMCNIANYADDNTIYATGERFEAIVKDLYDDLSSLQSWFYENYYMILNPKKCYFMCLEKDAETIGDFNFQGISIKKTNSQKLLGVIIDHKLKFEEHISSICQIAGKKLNALTRLSHLIAPYQLDLILNSFIKGQFNYCPLIWMFSSKRSNNLINKIHERTLRLIHNDYESNFSDLLKIKNEVTFHVKNNQKLMTEVYKYVNGLSNSITCEIFSKRNVNYNLRNFREIKSQRKYTSRYGLESVNYKASQLWQNVPMEIKNSSTLEIFKTKIKSWTAEKCPCWVCN